MKTSDFNYELPEELIARYPSENRGDDRLMLLDRT
jgi:S-adenosylmethionine:tRNA ribosyltransferase-isomerase